MARVLQFKLGGATFEAAPVKLDRSKIYGRVDTVATDAEGGVCTLANIDAGGTVVIPTGGTQSGYLDSDGNWVERSELVAVGADGKPLTPVPSSFDAPIELSRRAPEEEFLDHIWKSVYQLSSPDLAAKLGDAIYAFPFSYRGGVDVDDGYLLAANGLAYLFAGSRAEFSPVGLKEAAALDEEPAEGQEEAGEELSFDMM